MRILLSVIAIILTFASGSGTYAAAQGSDVDVDAIAERMLTQDPDEILAALEDSLAEDNLPVGFSGAQLIDPAVSGGSASIDEAALAGIVGTVTYTLVYEPGGVPATPGASPVASPQAAGPTRLYSQSALHYVVFDHEINPDDLTELNSALQASVGTEAAESEIHETTIGDTTAFRFSMETTINDVPIHVEWLAIPVGNVAVISMTMTGGETVDLDALAADAEAIALAGVGHLDTASARERPAG